MQNNSVYADNFFLARSPKFSFETLTRWQGEHSELVQALKSWLEQPGVKEALYIASPSLCERLLEWKVKPGSKQEKKLIHSLAKYFIRMCSRPTPFGLFSGISNGEIAQENRFELPADLASRRITRLDMFYLSSIKDLLAKKLADNPGLKVKLNTSSYPVGDQLRYIEAYQSKDARHYRLSSVEIDECITWLRQNCQQVQLLGRLKADFKASFPEADSEDIDEYFASLVEEGVLVPELLLSLTDPEPATLLAKQLVALGEGELADAIMTAVHRINEIDKASGADIGDYKAIYQQLKALPFEVEESKLFQVDWFKGGENLTLSESSTRQLLDSLTLLHKACYRKNNALETFTTEFNKRFEGQFVPLSYLLDDESGISYTDDTGYETPLLAGLQLIVNGGEGKLPAANALESLLLDKIALSEGSNTEELRLSKKELKKLTADIKTVPQLPGSFSVMCSLHNDEHGREQIHFQGISGPSAGNLMGRFCHLDDKLYQNVKQHLEKEEALQPDAVFAEIVHLPEGRPGNVIARPRLREHEIVFLADTSLSSDKQIPVSDLYVCVEGSLVKLWSKRLNKQIIPRLSSAHNYSSRSLGIYKFLCMLQHQEVSAPNFSWPASLNNVAYTPRVKLDNIILAPRTWRLDKAELEKIKPDNDFADKVQALLKKFNLPRVVTYSVADNVLTLDLLNPICFEILLSEIKYAQKVTLKESVVHVFPSKLQQQGQHFAHELLIPFINKNTRISPVYADHPDRQLDRNARKRNFMPGSEWLSIKIYGGNSQVEKALIEKLAPAMAELKASGVYEKSFFIRYGDPDWHLRLRFYGAPDKLMQQVLPACYAELDPLIQNGQLKRIELFTYDREVERYGGATSMPYVENIFAADSITAIETAELSAEYDETARGYAAILGCDRLLDDFGLSMQEKYELMDGLRIGYGKEFNENARLRKQLGEKFREHEQVLKTALVSENDDALFSEINSILKRRSELIAPDVKTILALDKDGVLGCEITTLLNSILHMHTNRMFKAYGRQQELVAYDFLRRYYHSSLKHS
ncbi:lantibiotic dehydratase [Thalassomonas actiniarum]|uniref:Lantibiotic dehydratase n=1 Tax=Thalassomonas actiniarum TaxID=485447 RepID=A0AAE9YMX4_9GAMM|nr:lantibiotic dehydratase [Thalassomonas actiniarum]WDD98119.1 lantibiotic dehydratase [Thalassomonas actiniarum]